MNAKSYPEQVIMFARLEGQNKDGSPKFGEPRLIGTISPLEGQEQRAGHLYLENVSLERKGLCFVCRLDDVRNAGKTGKRSRSEPERER